jgi:hypothetical protein
MNRMLVSMAAAIGMAVMPALAEDPGTDLQGIIQWGLVTRAT